jgi:hypothetical protein
MLEAPPSNGRAFQSLDALMFGLLAPERLRVGTSFTLI